MTDRPPFIDHPGRPPELDEANYVGWARKFWGDPEDSYNGDAAHAREQGWLTPDGKVTEAGRAQLEELVRLESASKLIASSREPRSRSNGRSGVARPKWNERRFTSSVATADVATPPVSRRALADKRKKAKEVAVEDMFLQRAKRVVETVLEECGRLNEMPNYTIRTGRKDRKPMVRLELVNGNGKKKGLPKKIEASAPTASQTLEQLANFIRREFGSIV